MSKALMRVRCIAWNSSMPGIFPIFFVLSSHFGPFFSKFLNRIMDFHETDCCPVFVAQNCVDLLKDAVLFYNNASFITNFSPTSWHPLWSCCASKRISFRMWICPCGMHCPNRWLGNFVQVKQNFILSSNSVTQQHKSEGNDLVFSRSVFRWIDENIMLC